MEVLADRYRRVRSLGSGAMGEVWLAEDTLLSRPVAIKQLRTDPESTLGQWGDRIRREARLAAQLNHPPEPAQVSEAARRAVASVVRAGGTRRCDAAGPPG